ncbi:MAG: hypothetical protein SOV23_05385 [Eubacteriales bacterium]|nr:hypothetical protein [Christensenellaceae bacterium]MDY2751668.1 hypothetical protein [Eubacteriales bacterium]
MKAFLKVAKIICYVCSFPLFMVFAIIASMNNVDKGGSYGVMAYVSIIVAVLFTVIWAIIVITQEVRLSKKDVKNKAKKIQKQTARQVVACLLLTCGLMFVLDAALPMIFGDLTSGTIFYEDVAESDAANNRADLNKDMLDAVIARCVLNGIIGADADGNTQYFTYYKQSTKNNKGEDTGPYTGRVVDEEGNPLVMCKYGYYVKDTSNADNSSYTTIDGEPVQPATKTPEEIAEMKAYFEKKIAKYTSEGYKNKEVQSILSRDGKYNLYDGLNLSGYESWVGPWVDLANDSRMTIPVVLNLVLGQRTSVQTGDSKGSPKGTDVGTREMQTVVHEYPWYNPTTCKVEMLELGWTVLDMMGDGYTYDPANIDGVTVTLPVDLSGAVGSDGLFSMITSINIGNLNLGNVLKKIGLENCLTETSSLLGLLDIPPVYYIIDSLLNSVAYAVGNPAIAGTPGFAEDGITVDYDNTGKSGWMYGFAPLYIKLVNADGSTVSVGDAGGKYYANIGDKPTQLGVYSQNYSRGTIDYMRYSWTDANGLLFAITGLFAIRKTCYIFAGITVILAVVIGAIRMKIYRIDHPGTDGKNHPEEQTAPETAENVTEYAPETQPEEYYATPYDNAYGDETVTFEVPPYDVYNN